MFKLPWALLIKPIIMLLFNGPNIHFVVFCAVFNYHWLCITAARAEGSGTASILQAFVVVCLLLKKFGRRLLLENSFSSFQTTLDSRSFHLLASTETFSFVEWETVLVSTMAEYLASIFGTEKDKVNCSFYFKIGACRHGDRCSRIHNKPTFSQTIVLQASMCWLLSREITSRVWRIIAPTNSAIMCYWAGSSKCRFCLPLFSIIFGFITFSSHNLLSNLNWGV